MWLKLSLHILNNVSIYNSQYIKMLLFLMTLHIGVPGTFNISFKMFNLFFFCRVIMLFLHLLRMAQEPFLREIKPVLIL